jgi:hypothetical protein
MCVAGFAESQKKLVSFDVTRRRLLALQLSRSLLAQPIPGCWPLPIAIAHAHNSFHLGLPSLARARRAVASPADINSPVRDNIQQNVSTALQ